jgi:molecular chaperone DnaK (HSP70)
MPVHWAIDLGTSNTTVCEDSSGSPNVVELDEISRPEPVTMTPLIPSAICVLDESFSKVLIGQKALAYNWDGQASGFATGFKRFLGTESQRPLAKVGSRTVTARDAAFLFLRELINTLEQRFQTRITDLTIAVPPSSYETYRAEIQSALRQIKRPANWWQRIMQWLRRRPLTINFRTIDEPVASALGYGIDIKRDVTVVAFDFGAGSLEAAAVRIEAGKTLETGRAQVLAKQSLRVGGDDVDRWIVEEFVPEPLRELPTYKVLLKWEAERVKIAASSGQVATFTFRQHEFGTLDYYKLADLLAERGLYREINDVMERLLTELWDVHRMSASDIDEVVLEGGSTLLPEVRNLLANIFGREKVREWAPFESVARVAFLFSS